MNVMGNEAQRPDATGLSRLTALDRLPRLSPGVTVHYEGSIDKRGGNADWDWGLYQDPRGEWVLLDVDGPGCLHNFVQHRYPSSAEPLFRFYFDGEPEPRFAITPKEFGHKPPFLKPLADVFVGDDVPPAGRGPIWVVRSFVPMPFRRACRITSSVKLEGYDKTKGQGGWGHAIYHRYVTADGVETFTGREDHDPLLRLASAAGRDPKDAVDAERVTGAVTLEPQAAACLFEHAGAGSVSAVRLSLDPSTAQSWRSDLWLRLTWDGHAQPDVDCPLGAFFGNEIGNRRIGFLTHGQAADGTLFCFFPMPFWQSARAELVNRGQSDDVRVACELDFRPMTAATPRERCGYFRASPYYPPTVVRPGHDSHIADIAGRGHIVAVTLTGRPDGDRYVSCEGDVRLYLDGCATPQIESDGSESHACYGWGFVYPPQQNPFSGYDGSGHRLYAFSETRVHLGDRLPFQRGFRFCLEAGGSNDVHMLHSGVVLYYGRDEPGLVLSDSLVIGDAASEAAHACRAEGVTWEGELASTFEDDVSTALTARGRAFTGHSAFTASIRSDNGGVRLRRLSDQQQGRQRVRVYVDDAPVTERTWYVADGNPHRRWLEDEFEIPPAYTRGKSRITVRLEHVPAEGAAAWTEFRYEIYSWMPLPEGARRESQA